MAKGKIIGLNDEVLTTQEKNITKNVYDSDRLAVKKAEVDALPPFEVGELGCKPLGSRIIARGYLEPTFTEAGIIKSIGGPKLVPCLQVMETGPLVKFVKVGQWVMINDSFEPSVIRYGHEVFHMLQEHDCMLVYDEQPAYDDIIGTSTTIVRDLCQYVKTDKLGKVKAKITEVDESVVHADMAKEQIVTEH